MNHKADCVAAVTGALDDLDTAGLSLADFVDALEGIYVDVKTRLEAAREDLERAP